MITSLPRVCISEEQTGSKTTTWHTCTSKHMIGTNTSRRLHSLFSFLFLSFLSSSYFLLHPSFLSFHHLLSVFSSSYHSSSFSYHYFTPSMFLYFLIVFLCLSFLLSHLPFPPHPPRHSLTFLPSSCLSFPHHSFPCTPPSFPLFCLAFLQFLQLTFPSHIVILPLPFSCVPIHFFISSLFSCLILLFLSSFS